MGIDGENFIDELKNKKPKAMDYIIENYGPLVKGVVSKVLCSFKDNGTVDECMSDVFMAVWQNSLKFTGDKNSFRNWIACVAKYKAIDYYRRLSKKPLMENVEEIIAEAPDSVEDEIILLEDKDKLKTFIDDMEETNKKIFIMKFFLGLTSEKIGEKLNLSHTAVDNRIMRERKKLKDKLNETQREVI